MALISLVAVSTGTISGFVTGYNQSISALNTDLMALSGRISGLSHLGSLTALSGAFRVQSGLTGSSTLTLASLATLSGGLVVAGSAVVSGMLSVASAVVLAGPLHVASGLVGSATLTLASLAMLSGGLQVASAAVFSAAVSVTSAFSFGSAVHFPYLSTTASAVVSEAQTVAMGTSCAQWFMLTVSGVAYRLPLFSAV